ncbi:MAG: hypothetical protein P4L51_11070 [Puia sp.]|nr:hypothetical protein [Puia sp.]
MTTLLLIASQQQHTVAAAAQMLELNPVENIWQFMRENWLSKRFFRSSEDITNQGYYAWNKLIDQP